MAAPAGADSEDAAATGIEGAVVETVGAAGAATAGGTEVAEDGEVMEEDSVEETEEAMEAAAAAVTATEAADEAVTAAGTAEGVATHLEEAVLGSQEGQCASFLCRVVIDILRPVFLHPANQRPSMLV